MKHKTLRCTAETVALLLTVAMLAFLIAGLHQHDPDRVLSSLNTSWYQLTDGVRREIAFPVTLPAEPGQTLTLYNDTLTARDAGKMLSARGVEYGIEIRAGETQPVVPDRFRSVSDLRTGYCRRKRRFLLRLYADVYPDGAFCPQHDKRQTAARSRYMHCTVLRQRARTGRGVPAFRHPVY